MPRGRLLGGLASWLSFVVSGCEFVAFPLVSWVGCGAWLHRFLIFAPLLTLQFHFISNLRHACSLHRCFAVSFSDRKEKKGGNINIPNVTARKGKETT